VVVQQLVPRVFGEGRGGAQVLPMGSFQSAGMQMPFHGMCRSSIGGMTGSDSLAGPMSAMSWTPYGVGEGGCRIGGTGSVAGAAHGMGMGGRNGAGSNAGLSSLLRSQLPVAMTPGGFAGGETGEGVGGLAGMGWMGSGAGGAGSARQDAGGGGFYLSRADPSHTHGFREDLLEGGGHVASYLQQSQHMQQQQMHQNCASWSHSHKSALIHEHRREPHLHELAVGSSMAHSWALRGANAGGGSLAHKPPRGDWGVNVPSLSGFSMQVARTQP
jgi:hypothetical protein